MTNAPNPLKRAEGPRAKSVAYAKFPERRLPGGVKDFV